MPSYKLLLGGVQKKTNTFWTPKRPTKAVLCPQTRTRFSVCRNPLFSMFEPSRFLSVLVSAWSAWWLGDSASKARPECALKARKLSTRNRIDQNGTISIGTGSQIIKQHHPDFTSSQACRSDPVEAACTDCSALATTLGVRDLGVGSVFAANANGLSMWTGPNSRPSLCARNKDEKAFCLKKIHQTSCFSKKKRRFPSCF